MIGFTRSDKAGNFIIKKVPAGKFLIMITHPAYADYIDEVVISATSPTDLGKIIMRQKSQLLAEVIVSNAGAIRIKGDTTEFKADSFHLKAGSTIEDLLKKLPGIQVDKNGKITAQGQAVQKVLVDGEEFFSDDPTVATEAERGVTRIVAIATPVDPTATEIAEDDPVVKVPALISAVEVESAGAEVPTVTVQV